MQARLILSSMLALVLCVQTHAQAPSETQASRVGVFGAGVEYAPHETQPIRVISSRLGLAPLPAPTITVSEEINVAALAAEDEQGLGVPPGLKRIGVGRVVHVAESSAVSADMGVQGVVYAVEISSPGALGVRLHMTGVALGQNGRLTVSAPGQEIAAGEYIGAGPFGTGEFWTSTVWGDRVRIEVHLPGEEAMSGFTPRFSVDQVSHIYSSPVTGIVQTPALPCENDAACWPAWSDVASAVATYSFIVSGGTSVVCTGQLINTVAGDLTPYFLTASHCIDTNPEAQSAEFYWFYQAPNCGGTPPPISAVPTSNIATLLQASSWSDYSLLLINGALPAGVRWVGWTSAPPADGTPAVVVHHPGGSPRSITFGTTSSASSCRISPNFSRLNFTSGVVELGSSGSGFYRGDTQQLIGQLFGVCEQFSCTLPFAVFGKFSSSFPQISAYLNAGSNDQFAGANASCGTSVSIQPGIYQNLVVKSVQPDWFKVTIPSDRMATFNIQYNGSFGNVALALYSACGTSAIQRSNVTPGSSQTIMFTTSRGGDYYLCAYLLNSTRNTYRLSFGIANACLGDANGDNMVNFTDLSLVISNIGLTGTPGSVSGDVNGDGVVDFSDVSLVLANFGRTC